MQVDNTHSGTSTGGLNDPALVTLRVEMARRLLTQTRLGEITGLSQAYISRRMTGSTPLDADDLALLSRTLDVPVTDFLPERARAIYADIEPICGPMPALVAALYVSRSADDAPAVAA